MEVRIKRGRVHYPLVDTTCADRIRPFVIAEIRMIGDLLLGRR
jgi:hypothetical protein